MKPLDNRERGQTLVVAVLVIIVIFFAALFLFDLQSVIRVKVKTQTAADAAALAGAEAQVDSLNLIGEINIIKACTVLVGDFSGDDSAENMSEASSNLTEMQARISFVGPLLGVGAAQQAAKNNGMMDYDTLTRDMEDYLRNVEDDAIYGNSDIFTPVIEGYSWREPYINMLRALNSQHMVAAPQTFTASFSNEFSDPSLYSAILSDFWCNDPLRRLIKDDSNFIGPWWKGLVSSIYFIEESELMPLCVRYRSGVSAFKEASGYLEPMATQRNINLSDLYNKDESEDRDNLDTPIPYMRWCVYDGQWFSHVPGRHWVEGTGKLYLRRGIRDEYIYGGAYSAFRCVASDVAWLSGAYRVKHISRKKGVLKQLKDHKPPEVEATAAAKPLGYIEFNGTRIPPNSIDIILPVFKSARLTPTKLPPADQATMLGSKEWAIYKFLVWCNSVNDINNPSSEPPDGSSEYLRAFQKLNNPLWRHSGWNPSYAYSPPGEAVLYDPDSDTGAGYLQEPAGNPSVDGSDGYIYDEDGNITGVSYTNDDLCDWHPSGGTGGHTGGGGPGSLH